MSSQGRLEEATQECLRAIEIDSEFGNPYNDIGVYLMQRDKLDEAIPWLEKAKQAPRYEPRQFPFMNLGRIYLKQGRWWEALREFEGAVRLAPSDVGAAKMLHSPACSSELTPTGERRRISDRSSGTGPGSRGGGTIRRPAQSPGTIGEDGE